MTAAAPLQSGPTPHEARGHGLPSGLTPAQARAQAAKLAEELGREVLRRDLLRFVVALKADYQAGWVHRVVCDRLQRFYREVKQGLSPRLILNLQPRAGKSLLSSIAFPAWLLGREPTWEVVVASYSKDLSTDFSVKARDLTNVEEYRRIFPDFEPHPFDNTKSKWATRQGGSYLAVGVGGPLTGRGAHALIIDDTVKNREDAESRAERERVWHWYTSTAYTRLAQGGGVLVLQTRWHEDDLCGRLIAQAKEDPKADKWEVLNIPAIALEDEEWLTSAGTFVRRQGEPLHAQRRSVEELRRTEATLGPYDWSSLYMGSPIPAGGAIFKSEWLRHYQALPDRMDRTILSVDATFKDTGSSFVVLQVWGKLGPNLYLIDQVRRKMGFQDTVAALLSLNTAHRPSGIYIEDKANGPAILDNLRAQVGGMVAVEPRGSKVARAHAVTAYWQAGNVWLPPMRVSWMPAFVAEVLSFPAAPNDDQVDCMTQAITEGLIGKTFRAWTY